MSKVASTLDPILGRRIAETLHLDSDQGDSGSATPAPADPAIEERAASLSLLRTDNAEERRAAGAVSGGSDIDLLGRPRTGARRRDASRALLG